MTQTINLEIQDRCFLGLKAAFDYLSRAALLDLAIACVERAAVNQTAWGSANSLPPFRLDGRNLLEEALERKRGAIVCSFHVGAYQRIPFLLARCGYPVTVLLDDANFRLQENGYIGFVRQFAGEAADLVEFINAEESVSLLRMTQALRAGRILLVYADGQAGFQQSSNPANVVDVVFCGLRLRLRKGFAFLSSVTNAPIISVFSRYDLRGEHVLQCQRMLERHADEEQEAFCARAMQDVYGQLETLVMLDPSSWEEWSHCYKWIIPDLPSESRDQSAIRSPRENRSDRLAIRADRIELLSADGQNVLINCFGGAGLTLTPVLKSLAEMLDGSRTVSEVVSVCAEHFSEDDLWGVLEQLVALDFVSRIPDESELPASSALTQAP